MIFKFLLILLHGVFADYTLGSGWSEQKSWEGGSSRRKRGSVAAEACLPVLVER